MTDNQTTEILRKGLTERGIEWRGGWVEGVTFVGDWCFVEYDNRKLAATCEPVLAPEQAIAAMLGNHETVRCRDCRFAIAKGYGCGRGNDGYLDVEPDGFCAWAKYKEDNNENN